MRYFKSAFIRARKIVERSISTMPQKSVVVDFVADFVADFMVDFVVDFSSVFIADSHF